MIGAIGEGLFEVGLNAEDPKRPLRRGYGGDAANTLVMAARLGASARLCSRVGNDAVGMELKSFWAAEGIDVRYVSVDDRAATGVYLNETATAGHRFQYYRRASAGSRISVADFDRAFVVGLTALHVTGVSLSISPTATTAAETAVQEARGAGAIVSYSVNYRPPLQPDSERLLRLARAADLLFISVEEATALIGIDAAESIHRALRRTGETIVTDGLRGASVVSEGRLLHLPAIAVDVVDAVGAGDALAGSYLAIRLSGGSVADSLRTGIAAASLSCRRFGAALSYPGRTEVEQTCREHRAPAAASSGILPSFRSGQ